MTTHPDCKEVLKFDEAMQMWQQLQEWGQPHSYPVPGAAADGSPVWHLWGKPSWMTGERAAEACRVAPGSFVTQSPGSSAKAAKITPADRKRIDAQRTGKKSAGKPADQKTFF